MGRTQFAADTPCPSLRDQTFRMGLVLFITLLTVLSSDKSDILHEPRTAEEIL
jgi:hypothetical protein